MTFKIPIKACANPRNKGKTKMNRNKLIVLSTCIILTVCTSIFFGCGGGGGGDDGDSDGGGSADCDLVANPQENSFLQVENDTNTGIEWYLADYAFGAFLRPGECTRFGLTPGTYDLETTRCLSSTDYGCPNNGVNVTESFTVKDGEIYLRVVTEDYF